MKNKFLLHFILLGIISALYSCQMVQPWLSGKVNNPRLRYGAGRYASTVNEVITNTTGSAFNPGGKAESCGCN